MTPEQAGEIRELFKRQAHTQYMRGVVSVYNTVTNEGFFHLIKKSSIIKTRRRLKYATEEYDRIAAEIRVQIDRILGS